MVFPHDLVKANKRHVQKWRVSVSLRYLLFFSLWSMRRKTFGKICRRLEQMTMELIELKLSFKGITCQLESRVVLVCRPRKEVGLSDRGIGKTDNFILESTARIASIFVSSTAVHTYDFHIFTVIYSFRYNQTMRWNWLGLTLFFKVMFTVVFFFLSTPASGWLWITRVLLRNIKLWS